MSSYQYRKSHCGDKTVVRSSYLHYGISYTGKMTSLYWFSPQILTRMAHWKLHLVSYNSWDWHAKRYDHSICQSRYFETVRDLMITYLIRYFRSLKLDCLFRSLSSSPQQGKYMYQSYVLLDFWGGNSPVTSGISSQTANDVKTVSMSLRHRGHFLIPQGGWS